MSDDADDTRLADPDATDAEKRRLVVGCQGRYFEGFQVGDPYKHPYGRTVTETDYERIKPRRGPRFPIL